MATPMATIAPGAVVASGGASDFSAGLYTFLDDFSPSTLGRLYEAPSSCLSIFRLLPQTARHIVLNLLWYDQRLVRSDIEVWVRERKSTSQGTDTRTHLTDALLALARLHVITFTPVSLKGKARAYNYDDADQLETSPDDELVINDKFRANLRIALTGGGSHGSFGVPSATVDQHAVDVAFLDRYAENQWETIQHYMVGSTHAGKPSNTVLKLLLQAGLMVSAHGGLSNLKITAEGFQFLLEEVNKQLWDLLLEYLRSSSDTVEVLGFLFMLGSLELGRDYSTENLSRTELGVLRDLCDYGLIYQHQPSSTSFYPTRLATTLTSTAPPLISSSAQSTEEERGFLIVETNYKIYAYTNNALQISVLNLFVNLKSRFPNLVTGQITRDSIKGALDIGIKAEQIISYLSSRAHPQMRKGKTLLPSTVVDQLRLWEMEKHRVQTDEGFLYEDFSSSADFELVVNYARELGVLLWDLPAYRKMFVTSDGHVQVREYIKRRKAMV